MSVTRNRLIAARAELNRLLPDLEVFLPADKAETDSDTYAIIYWSGVGELAGGEKVYDYVVDVISCDYYACADLVQLLLSNGYELEAMPDYNKDDNNYSARVLMSNPS